MRAIIASLVFSALSSAAVATFDATAAANNASTRSRWLAAVGIADPANRVDFESGFTNGQNVSGMPDLFPAGLVIADTSSAHQALIRTGAGIIGGSNPVGAYSLVHNEQPYLELDFSANPIDYLGFLGIDHTAGVAIVTFPGGATANVPMTTTAGSGDSAQFYGIFRNDQPRIVKIQFGPFPSGDGSWGIDNIEFGSLPDGPKQSPGQPYTIQTFAAPRPACSLRTPAVRDPG